MSVLTVVVPCFNEEAVLPAFYSDISACRETLAPARIEMLFVDDGSSDGTLDILRRLHESDEGVHYLAFSRNFGKEAAIFAGLENAKGDLVALMDADLQDPPELLVPMFEAVTREGYDCAAARRTTRDGEGRVRSICSGAFYKLFNRVSRTKLTSGARDFRVMNREYVDAVLEVSEYNRFSKGIFAWVGYRTKWIEYQNIERRAGSTKWSFWSLFRYSIEGIVDFSTAPLNIASTIGILFCVVAMGWIVAIVAGTLITGNPVAGWPSLACIVLFTGGIQLFCTGILGSYLSRTYLETKRRPAYLTREQSD